MKKFAVTMLVAISLGLIATACQSSQKCAAYGEVNRYRIERNH